MNRRNNNSGIDWNLTRTVAAIQMGVPGAFPGMPIYNEENKNYEDAVSNNNDPEDEETLSDNDF